MSKPNLSLKDNFFTANAAEMLSDAVSDLSIVTRTGKVASNKVEFFGLLPSMRNLLCGECSHSDLVIVLPEEDVESVEEAIREMREELKINIMVNIFQGQNVADREYDKTEVIW